MESRIDIFPQHCSANHEPVTPVSFLQRAATLYGDKTAIVYGGARISWRKTHEICRKLASALVQLKICRRDIVAALAPNIPELYNLHFAVPMAGAILSALNPRYDAPTLAFILRQLEPKILFVDYQLTQLVINVLQLLSSQNKVNLPLLVVIPEPSENDQSASPSLPESLPPGSMEYKELLQMGRPDFDPILPESETDPISVNYTSGSTGEPKGVVYSHRATFLNSLAQLFRFKLEKSTVVFLWTVDMFRCNGWCCPWAIAAIGGTNICIRTVTTEVIFDSIRLHKVTHLCGAPAILKVIANAPFQDQKCDKVNIVIAGVFPSSQVTEKVESFGFQIFHGYGMTEVLGPAIIRPWKRNATNCFPEGQISIFLLRVDVKDPVTEKSVPNDGKTLGEVVFGGNTVMSGYFKSPEKTKRALRDGWYHTGDLGVRHVDGYVEMKDRENDVIATGVGIVSSLDVEAVLLSNPKVAEAAAVGKPAGGVLKRQVPCAFVKLKEGCESSAEEIVMFCKEKLPDFMVPADVVFADIPVNSTGKVQKFILREKAIVNLVNFVKAMVVFQKPLREFIRSPVAVLPLRNNRVLEGSEYLAVGLEELRYDAEPRAIYTGCKDGWIKRVTVNDSVSDPVMENSIENGGRPLGLAIV